VAERRVRLMIDGSPSWGRLDGDDVQLESGQRVRAADAHFLAPVEPSKIIATHLTYRSRVEEYAARIPPEPSYFMKPPSTLNGHNGTLRRPRGARGLGGRPACRNASSGREALSMRRCRPARGVVTLPRSARGANRRCPSP